MGDTKALLSDYFDILEEKRIAKYLHCKKVPIDFDDSESTSKLWKKHDKAIKKFYIRR